MSNDKVGATYHGADEGRVEMYSVGMSDHESGSVVLGAIEVADAEQAELRAEVDRLTATLNRVRALADEWVRYRYKDEIYMSDVGHMLMHAIAGPAPADPDAVCRTCGGSIPPLPVRCPATNGHGFCAP